MSPRKQIILYKSSKQTLRATKSLMNMQKLLILMPVLLLTNVNCHVSLNYPKARKYDLDFLDSFQTSGECGMNPGQSKTILEAGALVNIT